MSRKPLQWHPAFQAVLQIELLEDMEYLQFCKEYNLTDKPLRIDTLVIKAPPGRKIHKKIGRIFRQYNVVEYKGPTDSYGVNAFFKVMGYACVLQSHAKSEREIPPEELTITLAGNRYPRRLIAFLKKEYNVTVTQPYPGIYYISGLLFPLQVLVQHQLSKHENIWLSRLRQNLNRQEDIKVLVNAYTGRDQDPLYCAAMDLIVRANWTTYKEETEMCDALNELFADKLEAKKAEGIAEGIAESILTFLTDMGSVPDSLATQLSAQKDYTVLSGWLKLAVRADSVEAFIEQINR